MVKILAAGDIHDSEHAINKLAERALEEEVDLIILAGDIHGYNSGNKNILEPLRKTQKRILFIPGNCETHDEYNELKKFAKSVNGYYVTYDNVGIAGIGSPDWKLSHDENDFLLIKRQFDKMRTSKKILISHLHAEGTMAEFSGVPGESILRRAVEMFKPDVLVSAHIHEAEGIEDKIGMTRVFQVGRKGTIIEI